MINNIKLQGFIVDEIKNQVMANGRAYCPFTINSPKSYKDAKTDKWVNTPNYIRCKAFSECAEAIQKSIVSRDAVEVEGYISNESWMKDGQKKYQTFVIVNSIKKIDLKNKTEQVIFLKQANNKETSEEQAIEVSSDNLGEVFQTIDDIPF